MFFFVVGAIQIHYYDDYDCRCVGSNDCSPKMVLLISSSTKASNVINSCGNAQVLSDSLYKNRAVEERLFFNCLNLVINYFYLALIAGLSHDRRPFHRAAVV